MQPSMWRCGLFFFSSRRRHTRCSRDWSSDVCSSDLFTPEKRAAFHQEILRRISALPGVEQAAIGNGTSLPIDFNHFQSPFIIENRPLDVERTPVAEIATVSAAYFSVLKTPLTLGTHFTT